MKYHDKNVKGIPAASSRELYIAGNMSAKALPNSV